MYINEALRIFDTTRLTTCKLYKIQFCLFCFEEPQKNLFLAEVSAMTRPYINALTEKFEEIRR